MDHSRAGNGPGLRVERGDFDDGRDGSIECYWHREEKHVADSCD
jgi:hypothetical protein